MKAVAPEIIELEESHVEAFNAGDLERLLEFFDPEVVGFSSTRHSRIAGTDAMRKTFEYYLHDAEKMTFSISEPTVQVFAETAIITFYWTVTLHQEGKEQEIKGRGSHVYARRDSQWKIVHEHFSRAHHHVEK